MLFCAVMSDIQGYTSELLILNHNSMGDSSCIIANSIICQLLEGAPLLYVCAVRPQPWHCVTLLSKVLVASCWTSSVMWFCVRMNFIIWAPAPEVLVPKRILHQYLDKSSHVRLDRSSFLSIVFERLLSWKGDQVGNVFTKKFRWMSNSYFLRGFENNNFFMFYFSLLPIMMFFADGAFCLQY